MNRAALSLSSAFVVAVAMLSVARTANAQPYNCSGPYNGTCMVPPARTPFSTGLAA